MAPEKLRQFEENAGPNVTVLSTHNAIERADFERGSVTLNAKRAVFTIASALRADLPRTLASVRIADDRVGERMMDEDLNFRIDHAEKAADRPWQFCFILGGGWRRSRQAAEAAHNAGFDFGTSSSCDSSTSLPGRNPQGWKILPPIAEVAEISEEDARIDTSDG